MTAVHRFFGVFRDSPTYGRDKANLISGFMVGMTSLILNGAILSAVLPVMLFADDRDIQQITSNLEFGQILALILLGGAAGLATLLIPMRMLTVFWGPRVGRYFDQIVLSGISPLRFVIGKAMGQNLLLLLIVFLLLPYGVLCVALGGMPLGMFLACALLVWLYCMALSLVTLWVCLYVNELLAVLLVMSVATGLAIVGCAPFPIQPVVFTPFPALMQPVWEVVIPQLGIGATAGEFMPVFLRCAAGMSAVIVIALIAIHMGPLYGIIRENSTFGEVIRAGDSKRKRWFRLRLHIQRPSEIAFFCENRGERIRRFEGLIRWGTGFVGLAGMLIAAYAVLVAFYVMLLRARGGFGGAWYGVAFEFHVANLIIFGVGLALAVVLFSHARNTTYMKIPFAFGRRAEVATLDTFAFMLFALLALGAALAVPAGFEEFFAKPNNGTLYPKTMWGEGAGGPMDYRPAATEGVGMIFLAAFVVYALQRWACLLAWLRSASFLQTASLYSSGLIVMPFLFAGMVQEIRSLREIEWLVNTSHVVAMISPMTMMMLEFGELPRHIPEDLSPAPFYIAHSVAFVLILLAINRRGRTLRTLYPTDPAKEGKA